MIASLTGTVQRISRDSVIIDVAGVGYRVFVTTRTLATLTRGTTTTLLTTLVVRDDALNLYGFSTEEQQELFLVLQKVSGIGPRIALAALSLFTPPELCAAIAQADTAALQQVPGIGKRGAQRLVIELKDKVASIGGQWEEPLPDSARTSTAEEVREALAGLGFSTREADKAITDVLRHNPTADAATILRQSLTRLGGHA